MGVGQSSRQALSNPYTGVAAIFISRLLNDEPPLLFEDGAQLRDFVHVHVRRALEEAHVFAPHVRLMRRPIR